MKMPKMGLEQSSLLLCLSGCMQFYNLLMSIYVYEIPIWEILLYILCPCRAKVFSGQVRYPVGVGGVSNK
jgi:hypothetical protein